MIKITRDKSLRPPQIVIAQISIFFPLFFLGSIVAVSWPGSFISGFSLTLSDRKRAGFDNLEQKKERTKRDSIGPLQLSAIPSSPVYCREGRRERLESWLLLFWPWGEKEEGGKTMGKLEREKGLFLSLFLCWTGGKKEREKDPSISHTTHTRACWCYKKKERKYRTKGQFSPSRLYTVIWEENPCRLNEISTAFSDTEMQEMNIPWFRFFSKKGNGEKTYCLAFSCCFLYETAAAAATARLLI